MFRSAASCHDAIVAIEHQPYPIGGQLLCRQQLLNGGRIDDG
jgi:hypothetical protein